MSEVKISHQRWQILSRALLKIGASSAETDHASVRRFSTFNLFLVEKVDGDYDEVQNGEWYRYSCEEFGQHSLLVRMITYQTDIHDLAGFNNTGNICVWPSEEVLARYCLQNATLFQQKTVCELGGGMTCLAGMMVAVSSKAQAVLLTDGNESSMKNVETIVEKNREAFGETEVNCRLLRWDTTPIPQEYKEVYDYVLCADCVFFREIVEFLSEMMHFVLRPQGVVILVAPSRGGSLQHFFHVVESRFTIEEMQDYDNVVAARINENQNNPLFSNDLHYPHVIKLQKKCLEKRLF